MSRLTFSAAAARAAKDTNLAGVDDDEDLDEEPGEEIESAPPLKVGEEREINSFGLRKKLLKAGQGWETPVSGDEVTVHYVGRLPDGRQFDSSRQAGEPFTFKLGQGQVVTGLDHGIVTMKKGEISLFTVPSSLGHGNAGANGIPPGSDLQFEVELISWLSVVDVCKEGGIVKKILLRGDGGQPGDLDEVTVKYQVKLPDGSVVAETSDGGLEFHINEGHLCAALPKVLKTMEKGEKASVTVQPHYAFGEHGRDAENGLPMIPSHTVLSIDLELVSFKPVVDVTGDMKVVKKVLKAGEGIRRPKDGESVSVRYTATLEDGSVFEKFGFDGDEPLQFVIDEEQVIAGLDQAAATMAKGEISLVTVKPEYGYGNNEVKLDLATVPASSTLIYEIEMVDFTKDKELWELNSQEKIEAAEKLKENGNSLFKSGKYQRAAKRYDKAIEYISDDESFDYDEQRMSKVLRVTCWLNSAACSLKLKDFQGAIRLCSKVLDIESHNVKALFRRAQAYLETADLDLAELDVKKALEVDPQNREEELRMGMEKPCDGAGRDGEEELRMGMEKPCDGAGRDGEEELRMGMEKPCDGAGRDVRGSWGEMSPIVPHQLLNWFEVDLRDVKAVQKLLKACQAESNKRDAKLYANMFARMRKDTDVALKRLKVEKGPDEREAESRAMDTENTAAGSNSGPMDEMVVDSSDG